jgi:putative membrane protein
LIFSVILLRDLGAIDEMKYFVHFLITIIALMIAVILLPGMYIQGTNALIAFALMALILGLVNVFLRPLMTIISLGCIVFTLGFFLLVINAAILWVAAWICLNWLHIGFDIDGFWTAFGGSLIVSFVSFIFSLVFRNR